MFVGTSGWQYRDWRDVLYPSDVPMRRWLEEYSLGELWMKGMLNGTVNDAGGGGRGNARGGDA